MNIVKYGMLFLAGVITTAIGVQLHHDISGAFNNDDAITLSVDIGNTIPYKEASGDYAMFYLPGNHLYHLVKMKNHIIITGIPKENDLTDTGKITLDKITE